MASIRAANTAPSRIGNDAAPDGSPAVALDQLGGDAWTWKKSITGICHTVDAGASIAVVVNGAPVPALRDGDSFSASVRLRPGENRVWAMATLENSAVMSDEVIHTVRLSPRPTARITVTIGDNGVMLDGTSSVTNQYDAAPITGYSWSLRRILSGPPVASEIAEAMPEASPLPTGDDLGTITIPVPDADGEYLVSLSVTDVRGRQDTASVLLAVEGGRARQVDTTREQAAWTGGATVFGVVVRNVGAGRFQDVIERLDDLADLGIAALWLAPVTRTLPGHFGYEVTDYFAVRPEYGTLADFRRLVDEAHARGIRVLLDVVPNHTSIEHPYFRDAQRDGSVSPYHDLYDRDERGDPTHYFDWAHLPNLNFDNPDVRRFVTEALMFWVREMDVDGFRVDVAWGIQRRRPDYWLEFSAEFKRFKPDGLLIAEAIPTSSTTASTPPTTGPTSSASGPGRMCSPGRRRSPRACAGRWAAATARTRSFSGSSTTTTPGDASSRLTGSISTGSRRRCC